MDTDTGSTAQKTFELNNNIVTLDDAQDSTFRYDRDEQQKILRDAPWKKDPHFFQRVRVSAVALIKMVMHARSGGVYEIMGLMQGKIDVASRTIDIIDSFALPVQGTETRVSASRDADEFMVEYLGRSQSVGRQENVVGWYHSHPGYGCWLSGIDVSTQMHNQRWQDPFVAIVIDPNRTISAGRVDIGAFRTYPEGYSPPGSSQSEYQSIPMNKIEDFGAHANAYYPLKVECFKSSLDAKLLGLLWNKYWISTLSQSPLIFNKSFAVGQVRDLGAKLAQARSTVSTKSSTVSALPKGGNEDPSDGPHETHELRAVRETKKKEEDTPLAKASRDAAKIAGEANHGLIAQVLKDAVFNRSETGAALPPLI